MRQRRTPAPRWELCGRYKAYWVRFIANGKVIGGNPTQRYYDRRDALHSIELICGAEIWNRQPADLWPAPWSQSIHAGDRYGFIEVRDCTDRALAKKAKES